MAIENGPFEYVFLIENRDIPASYVGLPEGTPSKTNMDTQNYGLKKVTPLKYGHFGYLY